MKAGRHLFFIVLTATLLASPCSVFAQSLDEHLKDVGRHVANGDWQKAFSSVEAAAGRFKELYETADKVAAPAKQVADELTRGLTVFAGEPVELGALVEMIKKDTAVINSRDVKVPDFGDPMKRASDDALKSTDPKVRGAALDEVRSAGAKMRNRYQEELDHLKEARTGAQKLNEESSGAVDRGVKLEKVLDEINNSDAGPFLNIGGGKLAFSLLDMTLDVNPALAERESAANHLVKKYDAAIKIMEGNLPRYELFSQWVTFYRWQESVRENAPFSADLQKAEDLLGKIGSMDASKAAVPTAQTLALAELLQKTVAETKVTQERAAKLIEEARRKDAAAAADAEFRAMLGLASAVANGASAATTQPTTTQVPQSAPPIVIKNTTIFFNSPPQSPLVQPQPSLPAPRPD